MTDAISRLTGIEMIRLLCGAPVAFARLSARASFA